MTALELAHDAMRKELTDHWCSTATALLVTEALLTALEDAGLSVVATTAERKGTDEEGR